VRSRFIDRAAPGGLERPLINRNALVRLSEMLVGAVMKSQHKDEGFLTAPAPMTWKLVFSEVAS